MNKFQELKRVLKNEEVVQRYLGLPEKRTSSGSWYKSPFRKEKTASFLVSDKGIHDFGDSANYDVISFVNKYFAVTPKQALDILCKDFNVNVGNEYETAEIIQRLKRKREEEKKIKEKINNWYNLEMQRVSKEIILNQKCIDIYQESKNFEILTVLYKEQVKLEVYFEELFNTTEEDKQKMYLLNI